MEDRKEQARPGPIGLRLPEELKAQLEADAGLSERSLHGEIVHRLTTSVRPESRRANTLALIGDLLLSDISALAGQRDPKALLGIFKEAICTALDALGAKDANLEETQRMLAQALGYNFAHRVMSATDPSPAVESLAGPEHAKHFRQLVQIHNALELSGASKQSTMRRAASSLSRAARKGKGDSNA